MKLRSLYILSIIGLFLVVVIQLGGMIYAYDSYKNEAKRTLNECFRQAFIETVDNRVNNLPFPDIPKIPFHRKASFHPCGCTNRMVRYNQEKAGYSPGYLPFL